MLNVTVPLLVRTLLVALRSKPVFTLEKSTPHVELLCYEMEAQTRSVHCQSNDIACTRLIFKGMSDREHSRRLSDPDGHHLVFLPDANSQRPPP